MRPPGPDSQERLPSAARSCASSPWRERPLSETPRRSLSQAAKAQGIRCIAVTNAPRPAAELILESLRAEIGAADVIEDLVVGAECERAKPHPHPYLEAMQRLDMPAMQCVIFEDSKSGLQSAAAAAVRAVVGLRTSLSDEEMRACGATHTVVDWREVTLDFLLNDCSQKTCSPPP